MIDFVCKPWLEIAKWIIGKRREMQNGVKTDEILHRRIPNILSDACHGINFAASWKVTA